MLEAALKQHRGGKLKAACETYRKILKRTPRHAEALHLLGLATLELGRPGHAAQLFAKAAAVSPEEPLYRLYLGEAQRTAGNLDESAAAFRAALAIDPGYVPALASLGNVLKAQGNPVTLDVMPDSSHAYLRGAGWDVFLAAFPRAAAKD